MYALIPLLLVEVLSYVRPHDAQAGSMTLLMICLALLDNSILDTACDGTFWRSRSARTITKSGNTNMHRNSDCNVVNRCRQNLLDIIQWRACLALLHDLQDRWYGHILPSFLILLLVERTKRRNQSADFNPSLLALIACTTLHWITKPEATEGGENGTPQTLGVGFDENDKESGVVVETSQVSDNQRAASNSTTLV